MSAAPLTPSELKREVKLVLDDYRRRAKGDPLLHVRAVGELKFGDPAILDHLIAHYEWQREHQATTWLAVRETARVLLRATRIAMFREVPLVEVLANWQEHA